MQRDPRVYLSESVRAGELIQQFIDGKTLADYENDALLHSAVERQFEILGEALRQLAVAAPGAVESLEPYRRVVAFRNKPAHGYFTVRHEVVWTVATKDLPPLVEELRNLLQRVG